MTRTLTIPVKGIYFDQIKARTKAEEYRLVTDYWRARLFGKEYDEIVLTRGYPHKEAADRRLRLPYQGWQIKVITHPHFGSKPVEVFAIDVSGTPL
jgi:hypothetical protein